MDKKKDHKASEGKSEESRSGGSRVSAASKERRKGRSAKLEETVEALDLELEKTRDRYLRTLADLDNFRKRVEREKAEMARNASGRLVERLLEVLDTLDEAVAAKPSPENTESFVEGLRLLRERFRSILDKEGLAEIPSVGQPFDPNVHEAVMHVESDEYASDTVTQELRKGYRLRERLLRPAKVAVAK